jgi:hypothetical protein
MGGFGLFGVVFKGQLFNPGINKIPIDKEYKNAYKIYQILSTINDHVALTALGNLYRNGFYVTKILMVYFP